MRDRSRSHSSSELTVDQSNILVDSAGHARITDFGLAMVTHDLNLIQGTSAERDDSVRWIAPEILNNQETYSKGADVFSFAGVAIEVRWRRSTRD